MSSKTIKLEKNNRKVITLRCRKISSTSNRSQMSLSHVQSGAQKRRINVLLKNNKKLANTLEDVRCELSYKEDLLKDSTKKLNSVMHARVKLLNMEANLKSFVKDFEEVLILLKQDDTQWPVFGLTTQSRADLKKKMKNVIDVIEEANETDSMNSEDGTNSTKTHQAIENVPDIFNLKTMPTIIQTELRNKPRQKSIEQMIISTDINVLSQSQVQLPEECIRQEESILPCIDQVTTNLFENSNGVLPVIENLEIASNYNNETPKLSLLPSVFTSSFNLKVAHDLDLSLLDTTSPQKTDKNSHASVEPHYALSPSKPKNSKIPRMLDLLQKKKKKSEIDVLSRKMINKNKNSTEKTETFMENFKSLHCLNETESKQKGISVHNNENILEEARDNFCKQNKFAIDILCKEKPNKEENLIKETENVVKDLALASRRETFLVQNTEALLADLKLLDNFSETGSNQEKSSVPKDESNVEKTHANFCRRKTFVVKTSVKKSGREFQSSDRRKTFVKKLDNIEDNASSKNIINNDIDAVASSPIKNVQNKAVLDKHDLEIPVTSPVVHVNADKFSISIIKANKHNMKCTEPPFSQNLSFESKQNTVNTDVCEINAPLINNATIFDCAESQTELLHDLNRISVKNSFNELDEKGIVNVKVAKQLSNDNDLDIIEKNIETTNKIQITDDDIAVLDTPKSCDITHHKPISYRDFITSSESECESLPDIEFKSFKQVSVIKKTPIRKQIPVNNKKKVFVFNASKRSTIGEKRFSISEVQESCSAVQNKIHSNDGQTDASNTDYMCKSNVLSENQPKKSFKRKKNVTFSDNMIGSGPSIIHSESKTSEKNSDEPNAQAKILKVSAQVIDSIKTAKEISEKNNIKRKASTELDACNYKENIHPQGTRNSGQIGYIETCNFEDNSIAVVESTKIHCSDMSGKKKSNQSQKVKKNFKQRTPFDDIVEEDLISGGKKIMSDNKKKKKQNLASLDDIIATVSSNVLIEDEVTENIQSKKNKKKIKKIKKKFSK